MFVLLDWGMDKVADFVLPPGYEWGPTEDDSFRYLYPSSEPTNLTKALDVVLGRLEAALPAFYNPTQRRNLAENIVSTLASRKLIAPDETKIYLCKHNSDLQEGRGGMTTFAQTTDYVEAVKKVKGHGVMGVGDGEVYEVTVAAGRESSERLVYMTRWQDKNKPWYAHGFPRVWDFETR